jgi:raffinose/stachyose/melibiose transport system permease protein
MVHQATLTKSASGEGAAMRALGKKWQIVIMIGPAAIFYLTYLMLPVALSVYYSFTNYSGLGSPASAGVSNYKELAHDSIFWSSLRNTSIILGIALLVLLPSAFLLAVLLSQRLPGAGAMRALLFAPAIVAPILVGLIWVFILDPKIGLINAVLAAVGSPVRPEWIGGTTLTPYAVGFVFVWEQIGFILTIFYAGIRLLDREVLEASALDCRNRWQELRHVVIPMLQETFSITTLLIITGVLRIFELVYELTGGGPVHLSDVLVTYMYYLTFTQQQYGYGMALAVVICVLGVGGSILYLQLGRRRRRESVR